MKYCALASSYVQEKKTQTETKATKVTDYMQNISDGI